MRQGDLGAARHWATTIGPFLPLTLMPYFYAPQLTLPKILLAQDTPASREQAAEVLSRLHAFVTATHNTRFTIEVLALQALLHETQGDERAALALLEQAVSLAEPGGFIRLFVDLGPRLARLFTRLRQTGVASGYTGQILQAFGESTAAAPHPKPMGRTERDRPPDRARARNPGAPGAALDRQRDRAGAGHLPADGQTTHFHDLPQAPGQSAARGGRRSDPPWLAVRPQLPLLHPQYFVKLQRWSSSGGDP